MVDTIDLGSIARNGVEVRLLSWAHNSKRILINELGMRSKSTRLRKHLLGT